MKVKIKSKMIILTNYSFIFGVLHYIICEMVFHSMYEYNFYVFNVFFY